MSATRVLVLMDSDSYVKWASALAQRLPASWQVRHVVLAGHAEPSARQVADALPTGIPVDVERVGSRGLRRLLAAWTPDVLLLGVRAHAVPAVTSLLGAAPDRPVVVTGIAGIAVPAQWYDVNLRRGADLFIVHSRRERREVERLAVRHGVPCRTALATLPFLSRVPAAAGAAAGAGIGTAGMGRPGPVVFAPQALVPRDATDRENLVRRLGEAARADPGRDVVVKLRARDGETQGHREAHGYAAIVARLAAAGQLPANLRVADGPMSVHLAEASALVTVGSTSALEAVAAGVPALVLDDFGVGEAAMNAVFEGSGLLGPSEDVVTGGFRRPDEAWARENYFHDPADDTWLGALVDLLGLRVAAGLSPCPTLPRTTGNRVRALYYRRDALGPWKGTVLAEAERGILAAARRVNERVLHLR